MSGGKRDTLGRAAGLISVATMLSRLLGLIREQIFAALLGAGPLADDFNVAYRVPNLLRALFAEGALSSAFVPVFKASLKNDGPRAANRLAAVVIGDVLVATGAIALVAIVVAPAIVGAMASDFGPGELEISALLARVMMPFLILVSLAAIAMGMLNAQDRYGAPAVAPALFNVAQISVGAGLWAAGVSPRWVAIGWAIGTVLGGAAQLGVQLPSLWKLGWRPRLGLDLRLRDPAVRRVALLMAPAVVGVAAVQVNVFLNTMFASSEPGAVSWLNYAFRFLQLPIGVFGVAIGTVSTTRYADAAADGDHGAMSGHVAAALRLLAFLTVPASVGLVVLDEPIIRLVFQHGHFDAVDTAHVAAALDCFAVGLVAYAGIKVLAPAFYAAGRTRLAVLASLAAVATNVIANLALHGRYGFRVLALDTALSAVVNAGILAVAFHLTIARLPGRALLGHLARVVAAAAIMGAAAWGARVGLEGAVGVHGLPAKALTALGPIAVGVVVYAGACVLLRVEELRRFVRRLR